MPMVNEPSADRKRNVEGSLPKRKIPIRPLDGIGTEAKLALPELVNAKGVIQQRSEVIGLDHQQALYKRPVDLIVSLSTR